MKDTPNHRPPKFLSKLLQRWAARADIEDLLGDLQEGYLDQVERKGVTRARWYYLAQVFSLISSYALRRRKRDSAYSHYYAGNSIDLLVNYVKISLRNFSKQRLFTSLNILGLAMGMSVSLLALAVAVSVYRFDGFHEKKDRIYQIQTGLENESDHVLFGSTFNSVGPKLIEQYPFVEQVVNVQEGFKPTVIRQGNELTFDGYYVEPAFLEVFSFRMLQGDPSSALDKPSSIVLTREAAKLLFHEEDAMGKLIDTKDGQFEVTGVLADLKETHFHFEALTTMPLRDLKPEDWLQFRKHYLYVQLEEGTPPVQLDEALVQVSEIADSFHPDYRVELEAQRVDRLLPVLNARNGIGVLGIPWDYPTLSAFLLVGLLILLPAVFNYTNLSIARALRRAKEMGVRKVVGAGKSQIKAQLIVETVLLSLIALGGAFVIFQLIREEFLGMINLSQLMDLSLSPALVMVFLSFAILVGFLAGRFPARYFSRLDPVNTIKGKISDRTSSVSGIKKGLFVFQFVVSLVFIIGVGAIVKQYSSVFNYNHGFTSENVLSVPLKQMDRQLLLNEFASHPDVRNVSTTSDLPGLTVSGKVRISPNQKDTVEVKQVFTSSGFFEQMKLEYAWGNAAEFENSTHNMENVLVNEQYLASVSALTAGVDSLSFDLGDGTKCRIVGVLKDLNYEPLSELIAPMVFRRSLDRSRYVVLTVSSPNIRNTIAELDELWTGIDQKSTFEATFLDDEIERSYHFLVVLIKMFGFMSTLVITISCLGLLGMVSYTTENRTKEIAIRKIMGASLQSIHFTLTKDFVRLILIAASIAIPVSYVFYDQIIINVFLRYGEGLGVLEVILSMLFLFVLGFLSIYWQSSRVANSNPAENLRYE